MSTTDIAPETVADVPAGAVTDDASGGAVAALASWLTSSDSKVIGRNFIGCSLVAMVGAAVLGVMLGAERIDGGDTLFDDGALPQMFVAFRIALVFGVLVPLLLGIAVAAVPLQVGARSLAFPGSPRPASGPGSAASCSCSSPCPTTVARAAATRTWSICSSPRSVCS